MELKDQPDTTNVFQDSLIKEFTSKMPKVELHAHLNGSLSKATMAKLYSLKGMKKDSSLQMSTTSLEECFKVFSLIHKITDSPSAIYTAAYDVIKEFHNDGVCHLELRSTPREVPDVMTRSSYVESVVSAIKKSTEEFGISVKLILSIDRRNSATVAEETVKIAEAGLSSGIIVGIDLSGDPTVGNISSIIPYLQRAKQAGLKLTLHMAEVPGRDSEVEQMLLLGPDRIGHGVFIHPLKGGSEANFNNLKQMRIPLEICLTSNIKSHTFKSYADHHFPLWQQINYPCVLCLFSQYGKRIISQVQERRDETSNDNRFSSAVHADSSEDGCNFTYSRIITLPDIQNKHTTEEPPVLC